MNAREPGAEVLSSTLLLATILTTTVRVLSVATGSPVGSTLGAGGPTNTGSSHGLLEGSGDDLSGEVEELAEVVDALGGEDILLVKRRTRLAERPGSRDSLGWTHVVVLPGELGRDEALGGEGLGGLDNEEVLHVKLEVLGGVLQTRKPP